MPPKGGHSGRPLLSDLGLLADRPIPAPELPVRSAPISSIEANFAFNKPLRTQWPLRAFVHDLKIGRSSRKQPRWNGHSAGISAKEVLRKWTDAEISALLSRPIFDDAIYGTVRFHHRSAREFLTAEWLLGLLEKPASRRSIEALLFKNQYGLDVVVPTMRSILPWLAISDSRIRERIRKIAPEVMFEGGDPATLPLPTRREILAEVCAKMANDTRVSSATEYSAVQRFAHADIADQIGTLLGQYSSNDEVVGFLVRMIWMGRLASLLPQAMKIALSTTTPRYTRIAAFRAVRAAGTADDDKKLRTAFLAEAANLDRELAGELVSDLNPDSETISGSQVRSLSHPPKPRRLKFR